MAHNLMLYEACFYTHRVAITVTAMTACLPFYWAYDWGTYDDNIREAVKDSWRSCPTRDRVILDRLAQRRKFAGNDKDFRIRFMEWYDLTPKARQELRAERIRSSNGIVRPWLVDTIFPTVCS